jgi:hypothetical protein
MSMKESAHFRPAKLYRGQSLVEIALMAPLLMLLVTGIVEMGFIFSNFLAASDAARNSARFSSNSDYTNRDSIPTCLGAGATTDFYRQTACLTVEELKEESPTITLCLDDTTYTDNHCPRSWDLKDDIIVSVFSVDREGRLPAAYEVKRFPNESPDDVGEMGWSYGVDLAGGDQSDPRSGMHISHHSTADVRALMEDAVALNTGFVLVEVNYNCYQLLALPWFTVFVPDPVTMNLYSIWPQTSAEPTST